MEVRSVFAIHVGDVFVGDQTKTLPKYAIFGKKKKDKILPHSSRSAPFGS